MPGSFRFLTLAVSPEAQTAGTKANAPSSAKCRGASPAYSCSAKAIRIAAADPAVPGAHGENPQPNHVASRSAKRALLIFLGILRRGLRGSRDHVSLGRPVAEVDQPAALAAKRKVRRAGFDILLTNRA